MCCNGHALTAFAYSVVLVFGCKWAKMDVI